MAIRMSGIASGMDTESIVSELMSAQRYKSMKLMNRKTSAEWKQEKWKTLNTKIYALYTGSLSKMKLQTSFNTKNATSSNDSKATVTGNASATDGAQSLKINQLAKAQFVTGAALNSSVSASTKLKDLNFVVGDTISVKSGTTTITLDIKDTTTVWDLTSKLKTAGLNANYDTTQKRFFISSKESGSANAFSLTSNNTTGLASLGLNTIDTTSGTPIASGAAQMTLITPADAKFEYNGVAMTSSSNTTTVNGLTITMKAVTNKGATTAEDEVINLNVTNNTQAVYDMVKGFVKEYNTLLKEMNENYNSDSAAGYDPLTDDQKEAMSDSAVDKWETKIKDALLRRDGNLAGIINTMRSKMNETVTVDNKKYALSSFGIGSANYTEKGYLHIDGDKDDSLVSGKTDKLLAALESDPDTVADVISTLATNLYTTFTENMKSSTLRSALTMYNDKELTKQITGYKGDLSDFEKKLSKMESRYYKQFSAMETAMAKMNSQSSSLSSMLGTNS